MKAVRFHQHGELDVLRYEDAPDPEASPGPQDSAYLFTRFLSLMQQQR